MKPDRRQFLGSFGLGTAGILGINYNASETYSFIKDPVKSIFNIDMPGTIIPGSGGKNPRDVKINVKVVYYAMIHPGVWHGPCRYGEQVSIEEEIIRARTNFEDYNKSLKNELTPDAHLLKPVYFEFPQNKKISRQDLLELEADKDEVDLYVLPETPLSGYLASMIGDIYKKPVVSKIQSTAYLRSMGLEGYVADNYESLNKLISLLRARKAFQQTSMLLITDIGIPGYPTPCSVSDFEGLNKRFGIGTTIIHIQELVNEREKILSNKNRMVEVETYTDNLIDRAQKVSKIGREQVMGDVLFFHTVKNLMTKYNCNAFSIECFELCGTRYPDKWQANPCLTHSLLRDEGFPSACEGDTSALLTLSIFMALGNNSAFMGNLQGTRKGQTQILTGCNGSIKTTENWVSGADTEGLKILLGHDVPGLKMLGFNNPDLPYELRNFVCGEPAGWGTQIKVDFTKIKEKTVTIGRLDPLASKIVVTKGEIIGMRGFDNMGCSTNVIIDVSDPQGYLNKAPDYGHHYVMTYGDYTQELTHLGDMLKIRVELHG